MIAEFIDPAPPRGTTALAFRRCVACDGAGFMMLGAFGTDRRYVTCPACGGCGQIYLEPTRA